LALIETTVPMGYSTMKPRMHTRRTVIPVETSSRQALVSRDRAPPSAPPALMALGVLTPNS
jgi:hypothetical protein